MSIMKPLNRISLSKDANKDERIGPNKRNPKGDSCFWIEPIIDEISPLPLTCDVRPIHPPYFSEFFYVDVMGGILLLTLSAEINARVARIIANCDTDLKLDVNSMFDKYKLEETDKKYKKLIMLAGSNATTLMDQNTIHKLMEESDDWYIKPHPVTEDKMIKELASSYGYNRIIDKKVSGLSLIKNADMVASTQCSELFLISRLLDKPVIDITRVDRAWLCTYNSICYMLDNSENDKRLINNYFLSEKTGYLKGEYSEEKNKKLALAYFDICMKEREKFKMMSTQKLVVSEKTFKW